MVAQKATEVKVNHQLNALKCLIGKEAHAQGIDCGDCSRKAAEVLAHYQQAYQSAEAANASFKQAKDIKEKTIATKNIATTKALLKKAEMDVNASYVAIGAFVLANNLQVPNFEAQLTQAHELEKQVHDLHKSVASTRKGLLKNKIGLVAVACVLMLICGLGWMMMDKIFDEGNNSVITASQLCDEYCADNSKADAKYKGRVIKVAGVSRANGPRTDPDKGTIYYEILAGSSDFRSVECLFEDKAEMDKIESAGNGIPVIIEGRCDNFWKGQVGERVGRQEFVGNGDKWGALPTMVKRQSVQHDAYIVRLRQCKYCGIADKRD
jgi:bacterioferritin-associated ferredoxin